MSAGRLADWLDHIRQAANDAHGYFNINLDVVWDTVQTALPELLTRLPAAPPDNPA